MRALIVKCDKHSCWCKSSGIGFNYTLLGKIGEVENGSMSPNSASIDIEGQSVILHKSHFRIITKIKLK